MLLPKLVVVTNVFAASAEYTLEASYTFLNFSSPAPYIFSSLSGLLQQWPNTFFPNGHTITACEIPRNSLFYHGRHDADDPPSPEWLAFDIEMSYGIMGSMPDSRIITYRTTRPVKCLYFDGMSASLMGSGTEAQMTFLYGDSDSVPDRREPAGGRPGRGRRPPREKPGGGWPPGLGANDEPRRWNPLADEYFRARGLCKWIKERGLGGNGWGYEGIIRMNAGFELIWCDFNSTSLQLVSNLNVSVPRINIPDSKFSKYGDFSTRTFVDMLSQRQTPLGFRNSDLQLTDEGPHGPGMADPREPFRGIVSYMWFIAATRRYGMNGNADIGAGETRAKVSTCGLFSFYDPALSDQHLSRTQQEQFLLNITSKGRWRGPKSGANRTIALEQLMRRRRSHRTNHVSKEDGVLMYSEVEQGLMDALETTSCSGIQWERVAHEIMIFYARHLRVLLDSLGNVAADATPDWSSTRDWLQQVRVLTHWFMLPYFEYPPGPYTEESLDEKYSMTSPAAKASLDRCQAQYLPDQMNDLNSREALLSWAIGDTTKAICIITLDIGLAVERTWLLHFNSDPKHTSHKSKNISNTVMKHASHWKEQLEELMAWLGWVEQWARCEGPCGADVGCFLSSNLGFVG